MFGSKPEGLGELRKTVQPIGDEHRVALAFKKYQATNDPEARLRTNLYAGWDPPEPENGCGINVVELSE